MVQAWLDGERAGQPQCGCRQRLELCNQDAKASRSVDKRAHDTVRPLLRVMICGTSMQVNRPTPGSCDDWFPTGATPTSNSVHLCQHAGTVRSKDVCQRELVTPKVHYCRINTHGAYAQRRSNAEPNFVKVLITKPSSIAFPTSPSMVVQRMQRCASRTRHRGFRSIRCLKVG
jgi:hypothetical protein